MAIIFHCNHCGKKIEAPDGAGGKWSKCPSCRNSLYVPGTMDGDDDLKLSPVDEQEENRKRQLMEETFQLEQDILKQRELEAGGAKGADSSSVEVINEKDLQKRIIAYLRLMADGQLGKAESFSKQIVSSGQKAIEILDRIALSDLSEPELQNVPPQILSGLIRRLRGKIT